MKVGTVSPHFYCKAMEAKLIENIVNEHFRNSNKFLVNVKVTPSNKIEIFIDSDDKITLDDCIELSQHIESQLDRDKEDFELMVSSAGITSPILLTRQFKKYIGQKLDVVGKDGEKHTGILKDATEEGITIAQQTLSKVKKGMTAKIKSEEDIHFTKDDYVTAKLFIDIN